MYRRVLLAPGLSACGFCASDLICICNSSWFLVDFNAGFVACTSTKPKIGIQASNFDCIKSLSNLHACFVASTLRPSVGIQASNFDRIKPPRRLRHIHLASKRRNPSFEFRSHQTSTPLSLHQHCIQASEFVASKLRLRHIYLASKHPTSIQAAESKL